MKNSAIAASPIDSPVMPWAVANPVESHQIRPNPTTWKPSWDDAPAWAGALAMCGHGNWYWLSHEGKHHELRNKTLVVNGPHAWSAIAAVGRLGFYCSGDEAKTMWEPRHNVELLKLGRNAGLEDARQTAEDCDVVEAKGNTYYAQCGDAAATQRAIVAAIESLKGNTL